MRKKILSDFSRVINPILGYVMSSVILVISSGITYAIDKLGFSFWGLKDNLPEDLLWALYLLFAILLFLFLLLLMTVIYTILQGNEISINAKINKQDQQIIVGDDESLFEIPIYLKIKNRNKRNRINCFAEITDYEPLVSADGKSVDSLDKKLKKRILLQKTVPRLQWNKTEYQDLNCEMRILPEQKEFLELVRIRVQLDESEKQGKPKGNLCFYFCKNDHPKVIPFGLHRIQITFYYKFEGNNEFKKRIFNGYLYIVINEKLIGWNLESGIRYKMTYDVYIDSGNPIKNKKLLSKIKQK